MPHYHYRAVHRSGQVTQGSRVAANENELAHYLSETGFELIELREKKETQLLFRLSRPLPPRDLVRFTSQMADLLKAGIIFIEALTDIADTMESGLLREGLTEMTRMINHGSTVAEAFAKQPRLFPPVYISILAAGEISGDLPTIFTHLTHYAETRARMNEQLSRGLRYPLFLLVIALGVISFMMIGVVPQIVQFLNGIDSQLPLTTRILISVSNGFAESWWIVVGFILITVFAVGFLKRHIPQLAEKTDALMLRLPVFGSVLNKLALARFVQSFALLVQSGLSIPDSLRHAKATLGNRALEAKLGQVEARIQSGCALSVAFCDLFPPTILRMIRTGEKSAQLGKGLRDIASAYDREVTTVTDQLIGSLEPALTLLIGSLLAWVVLAVLGPIYSSLSKLGGGG